MDAPLTFKVDVWQIFGFNVSQSDNESGKSKTIRKYCYNMLNTSLMESHLVLHHPEKLRSWQQTLARKKLHPGQRTFPKTVLKLKNYQGESVNKRLKTSRGQQQGISEVSGFHHSHISVAQCSQLFCQEPQRQRFKEAECVSLTTDGQAARSNITVIAHVMTCEWEIKRKKKKIVCKY